MPKATFHFPPDFKWGVATASHQVEGNNRNNQWWVWENQPGHILNDDKAGLACDWWQNAERDFDLAAQMGLKTLRLSIEWSRIEIEPGQIDTTALDRYRTILNELVLRGIEPMVTLHHFSNPIWFENEGGWLGNKAISYFARFVDQIVKALGEFTELWCTINEPNVYAYLAYMKGEFPPGAHDFQAATRVLRNMLKAHSAAYRILHQQQAEAKVGIAHNIRILEPANPKRIADRLVASIQDRIFNQSTLKAVGQGWWSLPLGIGPAFNLRHTIDWIGLNYYTRNLITFDRKAVSEGFSRVVYRDGEERMDGDYGVIYPEGLRKALKNVADMKVPIYITENGILKSEEI